VLYNLTVANGNQPVSRQGFKYGRYVRRGPSTKTEICMKTDLIQGCW